MEMMKLQIDTTSKTQVSITWYTSHDPHQRRLIVMVIIIMLNKIIVNVLLSIWGRTEGTVNIIITD